METQILSIGTSIVAQTIGKELVENGAEPRESVRSSAIQAFTADGFEETAEDSLPTRD